MKDFLKILAIWIVIVFVGLFFFGDFFLSGRHIYASALVFSLVPALITLLFCRQWEELGQLRDRVEKLEGTPSQEKEAGAEPGGQEAEQPESEAKKP